MSALTERLGLSKQAAADVGHLFTSASATSNAVTGFSWVFFVLGGIAMYAIFSVIFSGMVISYDQKYGPIGIVFGFMSFFIAIGVVITLGAAVGLMWQDRGLSFGAAVRKLRRAS